MKDLAVGRVQGSQSNRSVRKSSCMEQKDKTTVAMAPAKLPMNTSVQFDQHRARAHLAARQAITMNRCR